MDLTTAKAAAYLRQFEMQLSKAAYFFVNKSIFLVLDIKSNFL